MEKFSIFLQVSLSAKRILINLCKPGKPEIGKKLFSHLAWCEVLAG
jgi:hypothetical protein